MTQEEKAKAYDEAIGKLDVVLNLNTVRESGTISVDDVRKIFPELKENEDERIRKWIRKELESKYVVDNIVNNVMADKALAWLAKQGEQKFAEGTFVNVDDVREDFVKEVYRVLDADSTNDRANQIIDAFDNLPTVTIKQDPCDNCKDVMLNCHNFPCIKKKAFKQGKSVLEVIKEEPQVYKTKDGEIITYSETDGYKVEQKPQSKSALEAINEEKVDNANKVEPKDYSSIDPHFFKPIDKVEPKFNEGDWISGYYTNYKVLSVNNDGYLVEDVDGNKINILFENEKFHHLFTIADAKDYSSIDPHFGKPIDKVEPKFKNGDWITIKE